MSKRTGSAFVVTLVAVSLLSAHPGSGIVVDRQGQVYFADTGHGVWKIDTSGRLTSLGGPRFHWMTKDADSRFAKTVMPAFPNAEVTKLGVNPLLMMSSDFPLIIAPDGALYYPELGRDRRLQIIRFTSSGARTVLATLPAKTEGGSLEWLNGMAAGPDGAIYYTEDRSVKLITRQGTVTTVAGPITVPGCLRVPSYADDSMGPHLRGLAVRPDGTVFVAATGCAALLKVTPRGEVTPVLRTTSPWSPTAVAVAGDDLFVLEYLHTADENRSAWLPRVRKVSLDGKVTVLATIERR